MLPFVHGISHNERICLLSLALCFGLFPRQPLHALTMAVMTFTTILRGDIVLGASKTVLLAKHLLMHLMIGKLL